MACLPQPTSTTPKGPAPLLPHNLLAVTPSVLASLLLVARALCVHFALPAPGVDQILDATKASRSAAYHLTAALTELVLTLARPRGRPPKPPPTQGAPAASAETAGLTSAVLAYVMRHPGCVHKDCVRQQYSDGFRHFILEQQTYHAALALDVFAAATHLPLGTLKDWLRTAPTTPTPPTAAPPAPAASEVPTAESLHIQTVLDAWPRWHGDFGDFCEHVRRDLHLPFGRAFLAHLLAVHGARRPARRDGRSSDEIASRGSFVTFFPGAQWVGDGMQLSVIVDEQRFHLNLELDVDAHTGAFIGLSVRDEEDSAAVIEAFNKGSVTTGSSPLALLLDNRPSNHTPEIEAALGETLLLRATVERPQNKAHVEGAFGLFSRVLPELVLDTRSGPEALAHGLARIAASIWAQTMNHRPRLDRNGISRVESYDHKPSPEQLEDAKRNLRDIAQRQERARRTREQRCRPHVLALLDEHFARLQLLDPKRYVRIAIAAFPLNAILAGLAIFDGKKRAATLPEGVDARYLLGIVRNVADKAEGELVARAMLDLRLEVHDRMLAPLRTACDAICAGDDPARVCYDCVDRALATLSPLERMFWLHSLADFLRSRPLDAQPELFLRAARRIHATFVVAPRERGDAVRVLAEKLVPLA
jgi:hypothetical protein